MPFAAEPQDASAAPEESTVPRLVARLRHRATSRLALMGTLSLCAYGLWTSLGEPPVYATTRSDAPVIQGALLDAEPAEPRRSRPVQASDLVSATPDEPATPEARLMRVYALIATSQGGKALDEAHQLAQDVPNFRLAQLAYADLLSAHASPRPSFDAMPAGFVPERPRSLEELAAEAQVRVNAKTRRPAAGTVPAQFVFLAPEVRYAVAVDVSLSRVYLLENTPAGMIVKRDYYASVGKLGAAKSTEGDLRTPLGVYFVTRRVPHTRLGELHGAGALTLNYPNHYDQMLGRTGTGIWVHGVEASLFNRAPLATDGCVALANADLLELAQFVEKQSTPVVIAQQLEWVHPATLQRQQAQFMQALEAWREARKADEIEPLLKFYGKKRRTSDSATEPARGDAAKTSHATRSVQSLSVLAWHDTRDLMVVTLLDGAPGDARARLKRQYWMRQAGQWGIIHESTVG